MNEKIFIFPITKGQLELDRYYYLPPKWKWIPRIIYRANEAQLLFPVRFKPRWQFWESNAYKMIMPVIKNQLVTVYGSYDQDSKEELHQICNYLREKGYVAYILEDLPETPEMKPEDKVRTWGSLSRFCVMVDRAQAGHLPEYVYLQEVKAILAHLRPKGTISTFMIGRSPTARPFSPRTFEFDNSPLDILEEVITWAENELKENVKESEYYPWKRSLTKHF